MLVALAFAVGCQDDPPALAPSGVGRVPIDTLAPGEIAEGNEIAFGLRLPRDMRVTSRQARAVFALGRVHFEDVSNFVRDRVEATQIDTGPARTRFIEAVPLRDKSRAVDIEVLVTRRGTELVVRDRTRVPAEPGLSDEERWRRAGLQPNGKPTKDQME